MTTQIDTTRIPVRSATRSLTRGIVLLSLLLAFQAQGAEANLTQARQSLKSTKPETIASVAEGILRTLESRTAKHGHDPTLGFRAHAGFDPGRELVRHTLNYFLSKEGLSSQLRRDMDKLLKELPKLKAGPAESVFNSTLRSQFIALVGKMKAEAMAISLNQLANPRALGAAVTVGAAALALPGIVQASEGKVEIGGTKGKAGEHQTNGDRHGYTAYRPVLDTPSRNFPAPGAGENSR